MKRIHILSFALMALLVVTSCSTTREIAINIVEPSPVTFSEGIKKIGIVNASAGTEGEDNAAKNKEDIASMDERWITSNGKEAAIHGLFDELLKDKRFEEIKLLESLDSQNSDFGYVLNDDAWQKITTICKENGVDAIFALAQYDVDTKVSIKKTTISQPDLMRVRQKMKGQEITMETLIENGWRIYDPKNRVLIDEIVTNDQLVTKGQGSNMKQAINNMGNRKLSVLEFTKGTGSSYAQRMLPKENVVNRTYFAKGNDNFILADKKIQEGQLEGAVQALEAMISHSNTALSSKACYNLAVLSEYGGDLEKAVSWTEKSLALKNAKATQQYLMILKRRLANDALLQQQYADINNLE